MGQLVKLTLTLLVEDVNRAVNFYHDVLGFEVVTTMPKTGWLSWAILRYGSVEIMFESKARTALQASAGPMPTCYIPVESIDTLYSRLKNRGEVIKPMQTTFYGGKEFTLRDCNGIILTFAEAVV